MNTKSEACAINQITRLHQNIVWHKQYKMQINLYSNPIPDELIYVVIATKICCWKILVVFPDLLSIGLLIQVIHSSGFIRDHQSLYGDFDGCPVRKKKLYQLGPININTSIYLHTHLNKPKSPLEAATSYSLF